MCGTTIIIPTTCSKAREYCLRRAIDSALAQAGVEVEIIVVVNGEILDIDLFGKLKTDARLSVYYLPEGNVSKARYYGIVRGKHDCFAFLDDDDELLPNTLRHRLEVLNADGEAAVAVANGYIFDGGDNLHIDNDFYREILKSPELSFLEKNWFTTPSALYNKNRLDIKLFDMEFKYFELTYIFFKLIENRHKLVFDNSVAYRYHEDTATSASKSEAYSLAYPDMVKLILGMHLSAAAKRILKRKYLVSLNSLSNYFLGKGEIGKALYFHIKCLLNGGFNYIFYTRKLLPHH